METARRRVEVFTAGCLICEEAVHLVQSRSCRNCEIQVYDLREGCATNECGAKAARYGITAVPTVVVEGVMLECCRREPVSAAVLAAAGIGQP
jgi:hypothetical protein